MTETGAVPPGGPAGAADSQDVPGLDLAALGAYVAAANPGIVSGPLRASVLAGGKSNLTYEVSDGAPPLGGAPPAARPRARHRARHGARVPGDHRAAPTPACRCPPTYALCTDPE